jgi:hypothetical protein
MRPLGPACPSDAGLTAKANPVPARAAGARQALPQPQRQPRLVGRPYRRVSERHRWLITV